ncbi:MAG: FAD-binding oxidoreductase [Candidatus Doudnabacteria bacterium]|nr:FAD-binding oxidoreductase [Candidatus Doudnabacteria bacterium]
MIHLEKLTPNFTGSLHIDAETRNTFAHDASIFEAVPQVVARPATVSDIQALVHFATEETTAGNPVSLTPRAGGTDMTGGSISESIIVDLSASYNHIGEIEQKHIHVQPGAFYRDLEKITLQQNLIMPAYPASKAICGVGGMVGNNAGGEKSLSYGQVVDWVAELKAVLADGNEYTIRPLTESELTNKIKEPTFEGNIYRQLWHLISAHTDVIRAAEPTTSKNSAGYYLWKVWDGKRFDLTKLFVGSQGTLGIVTDITFNLTPVLPHRRTAIVFLENLSDLGKIVTRIKQFRPESFELFDDHTLRLALKYWPELLAKMGGRTLQLLWYFLPELRMILLGKIPKLVLIAEFAGEQEALVETAVTHMQVAIQSEFNATTRIARSATEAQKYWTIRRESYNLLRKHTQNRITACFIEDIIVHPDQLPEFLPRLNEIFARYPSFIYTIAGHAGDANFHIMPLMDLQQADQRNAVLRLSDEVFALVMEFKGSITAEHNDGIVRGPYLERMYGPHLMELFRQVKNLFDPLHIFNPHKKTDADMDYYIQHLRRK